MKSVPDEKPDRAAGAVIPSAAFLIPAMIERKTSGHGNARTIGRDLFIAIFIPIGA